MFSKSLPRRLFLLGGLLVPLVSALSQAPTPQNSIDREAEYLQKAAQSSIFIYESTTRPCDPARPSETLLPLGSGFVLGLTKKGSVEDKWLGWKFLITAQHVIRDRRAVILRLNQSDQSAATCFTLVLTRTGEAQNVFGASPGVDLLAITLPDIPGTDPVVFDYSMLLDEPTMKKWDIRVGTNVFTVGYLFGYSGERSNFPVTKFGHISILTEERWFLSPESGRYEQAYLVELQGTPGLSGAPVLTYGFELREKPFQFRQLAPYVVGVVKGGLLAPARGQMIPQGMTAVEPADRLKDLMKELAARLRAGGAEVQMEEP